MTTLTNQSSDAVACLEVLARLPAHRGFWDIIQDSPLRSGYSTCQPIEKHKKDKGFHDSRDDWMYEETVRRA